MSQASQQLTRLGHSNVVCCALTPEAIGIGALSDGLTRHECTKI